MKRNHYQLTFTRLRSDYTLHQIRHFITYLTKSTTVLSSLHVSSMHFDGNTHTLQILLHGPDEHINRLYAHLQTYFQDHNPTLEKVAPPDSDAPSQNEDM